MSLNTKYVVVKWVLSRLKCTKNRFRQGLPLPIPLPLNACGASTSSPGQADLRVGNPRHTSKWNSTQSGARASGSSDTTSRMPRPGFLAGSKRLVCRWLYWHHCTAPGIDCS